MVQSGQRGAQQRIYNNRVPTQAEWDEPRVIAGLMACNNDLTHQCEQYRMRLEALAGAHAVALDELARVRVDGIRRGTGVRAAAVAAGLRLMLARARECFCVYVFACVCVPAYMPVRARLSLSLSFSCTYTCCCARALNCPWIDAEAGSDPGGGGGASSRRRQLTWYNDLLAEELTGSASGRTDAAASARRAELLALQV